MTLEEGLGTKKTLMVVKEVEFGVYLGEIARRRYYCRKSRCRKAWRWEIRSKYSCIRILRTG